MDRDQIVYDVAIIGAGVTGAASAMTLAKYTNVDNVVIIEKENAAAQINSHPLNNSQTSHDGGTETNYDLTHALRVREAAVMLRNYLERKGDRGGLFRKTNRMVLAVGEDEIATLKARFEEFGPYYPDLYFADRKELAEIEPKVVEGRDPREPIAALVSSEGYAVNYQMLAEMFLYDVAASPLSCDVFYNVEVENIRKDGGEYVLQTNDRRTIRAKTVDFAAGAYSLYFAQKLGYGKNLALLPVAGSFFSAGKLLEGKVYRMQIEGMPFAAKHGDPDVLGDHETRFGPTMKPLPLMERYHYRTAKDYLTFVSLRLLWSMASILIKRRLTRYVLENILFDLPWIGPRLFVRDVRKIVPTLTHRDITLLRGVGGIRPQIVDLDARDFRMDETRIVGDNIIFNTTPSPGASVCLLNAKKDVTQLIEFLGEGYTFDTDAFARDFEQEPLAA